MRRILMIFLVALMAMSVPAMAQNARKGKPTEKMWKEMQEFKLKFLAQEMELKDDQQKKFVELYSQMSSEKRQLFNETRKLEKKLQDDKNASDSEYAAVSKALTEAKEKDAEIEKRYDDKFQTFLSAKQIFKMKAAEEKFRMKMHELRHKKKNR